MMHPLISQLLALTYGSQLVNLLEFEHATDWSI